MAKGSTKKAKKRFKKGDYVKINTGSAGGIPSVDDYFGIVQGPNPDNPDAYMVETSDGLLSINKGRLTRARR